jgi:uncharacterized protein (TIGR02646 family)
VIPIPRIALDAQLNARLDDLTARLKSRQADVAAARTAWRSAAPERSKLRSRLAEMAPGVQRCMYCGDSLGTDIDHFQPIAKDTARTFDWLNHLLACSHCNSNEKRDRFPLDSAGNAMLIDPTQDDPDQHLTLLLSSGEYRSKTPRGAASIEVYGLNRVDLALGRSYAFHSRKLTLCGAHVQIRQGRVHEATAGLRALVQEPFASVLCAMLQLLGSTDEDILGHDVVAALRDPVILGILRPLAASATSGH